MIITLSHNDFTISIKFHLAVQKCKSGLVTFYVNDEDEIMI